MAVQSTVMVVDNVPQSPLQFAVHSSCELRVLCGQFLDAYISIMQLVLMRSFSLLVYPQLALCIR